MKYKVSSINVNNSQVAGRLIDNIGDIVEEAYKQGHLASTAGELLKESWDHDRSIFNWHILKVFEEAEIDDEI